MRGAGDQLAVGERIAFYRARRGLTQSQLANLVARGPDWLSKIERGERQLRNVEILAELADTASGSTDAARRQLWSVSARTHHLAATALSKVGEADLSWIAAERAMRAADRSDDVMLHLRTAVAAARHQDRAGAGKLLDQAQLAADRLGEDSDYWKTSFGPTNVALHGLSVGLDLGDVGWMAEHGPRVGAENMPVERRVTHLIDVARAMSHLARDSEALDMLLSAECESPALVRHNAAVREAVKAMYRRAPVTGGARSSQLLALAKRCRAVQ